MKILLVAVNAKYIHSNLGIYSLKAYAGQQMDRCRSRQATIELAEYTINHQMEVCLQDIYRRRPDVIGFSCYIWNIATIRALAADLRKVLPGIPIWLGGPEVSFDAEKVLRENPSVTGVMKGEGEETFAQLARHYVDDLTDMSDIAGLTYRNPDGTLTDTGIRPVMDLNRIPFSYHTVALKQQGVPVLLQLLPFIHRQAGAVPRFGTGAGRTPLFPGCRGPSGEICGQDL